MSRDVTITTKQRILNVDDSEAGRYATSRILARAGFDVLEAATGAEALKLAAQRPDLILLDVNLPDVSGLEVCKRIKADPGLASIPVVYLSATYVHSDNKVQGLEGGADGYMVHSIDATELVATVRAFLRLQASEAALRVSEDRYRDLVEHSRDLLCTHDLDGKILWVNPAAERFTGYTCEALLGMNLADLLTRGARDAFPAFLAEIREKGAARGLMRIRTATGETRWWEFDNTLRIEGVAAPVVRGLAQDVTERKRAEEELRQSEANYRTLIESAPDSIYITDTQGRIEDANAQGCRMLGYTREELLRLSISDILATEEVAGLVPHLTTLKQDAISRSEWHPRRKDGTLVPVEVNATILPDGRVLGILRDISERKKVQAEIERQLDELRRWQAVMLGREDRNMDFKREVNALCRRLGEPVRYPSQEEGGSEEA